MKISVCYPDKNYDDEVKHVNRIIDVLPEDFQEIAKTQRHFIRTFKNNHVLQENCDGSSGHLLDFDDTTTIEEFENSNIAKSFNYILYTSRTHQKEKIRIKKAGSRKVFPACDRFHVILPFQSFENLKTDEQRDRHGKAASCLIDICQNAKLNPDVQCKNLNRKINPSFYPNEELNEFFLFKTSYSTEKMYISDKDIFEIFDIITADKTEDFKEIDTQTIPENADEWTRAVDFLKDKAFDKRTQWLTVGYSLCSKFGEEGLPLWLKFAENPNYNDSESQLTYQYKSLLRKDKKENSEYFIFAVANSIAKRDNQKIRFMTKNKLQNRIYNTDKVLNDDGSNYKDFFNSFCAFDAIDGSIWVDYAEVGWKPVRERAAFSLFGNYKHFETKINKKGEESTTITPAFKKWIEGEKRIITELVFTNKETTSQQINLFRGFKYKPIPGDVKPFLDYLKEVICQYNEKKLDFLLYFLACTFNFKKIPYYLILKGEQGAGKSFLPERIISPILGNHSQVATSITDIITEFNFHMADKLFCYLEEAYFGGDTRVNDTLKSKVTSNKQAINIKFGAKYQAVVYTNYMVTTNHDTPTKVERDDRRTVIFDVSTSKINNMKYYQGLVDWLENGGYSYVLDYILKYDISLRQFNFDDTKEKKEAKENSMDSVERFWSDILNAKLSYTQYEWEEGKKRAVTTNLDGLQETSVIYDVYVQYCKKTNSFIETQLIFSRKSRKIFNFEKKLVGVNRLSGFNLEIKYMIQEFNKYFKVEMISYNEIFPSEPSGTSEKVIKMPVKSEKSEIITENKPKPSKKSIYQEVKDKEEPPF